MAPIWLIWANFCRSLKQVVSRRSLETLFMYVQHHHGGGTGLWTGTELSWLFSQGLDFWESNCFPQHCSPVVRSHGDYNISFSLTCSLLFHYRHSGCWSIPSQSSQASTKRAGGIHRKRWWPRCYLSFIWYHFGRHCRIKWITLAKNGWRFL